MSTYKVIQDIEAEDHILGPLSLRQFIYAIIAAFCFYLCYLVASKGASYLIVLFLPPGLFCAFFAAPFGKDQPTEVWALAKIRFYFKPRKRIWNQSGMKELVTVTVPKKIEVRRTDGLSQTEIRSRLNALASTIDSRGWVVKDVDMSVYGQRGLLAGDAYSDRLVSSSSMAQQVPAEVVSASEDIMDAQSNPIAQQFDQMINASSQAHHQQLIDMLRPDAVNAAAASASASVPATSTNPIQSNQWFVQQSVPLSPTPVLQQMPPTALNGFASGPSPTSSIPQDDAAARELLAKSADHSSVYERMKTVQPLGVTPIAAPPETPVNTPKQPNQIATQLASNNDLNIATIARVANKQDLSSDEEVIIPLH